MPTVAITLTSDSIDGPVLCVSADPSDASGRRAGCVPMSTRPAPRPPRSNAFSASTTRRFCASSPPNSARNTRRAKSRRKRTCGSEPRPSRSCQVKEAVGGCPQVNLQTVDSAGPQQLGIASEVAACCARSSEPVMQREEDRYQLGWGRAAASTQVEYDVLGEKFPHTKLRLASADFSGVLSM